MAAPFHIEYKLSENECLIPRRRSLGEIHFGRPAFNVDNVAVDLPQLGDAGTSEVWISTLPVEQGVCDDLCFRSNDSIIFIAIEADAKAIYRAARYAYERILGFVNKRGYPNVLRIWNYFPDINGYEGPLERYKAFCVGRHEAMLNHFGTLESAPAATAIGSFSGKLLVYLIAAKEPTIPLENKLQMSAYHYPPQYGPKSPSFSRANLVNWGQDGRRHFYLSGTASIIGHQSLHPNDIEAQTKETVNNINSLIADANLRYGLSIMDISGLDLVKVYLRNPQHFDCVHSLLEPYFGAQQQVLYLHGDICRKELLIEIEGVYMPG